MRTLQCLLAAIFAIYPYAVPAQSAAGDPQSRAQVQFKHFALPAYPFPATALDARGRALVQAKFVNCRLVQADVIAIGSSRPEYDDSFKSSVLAAMAGSVVDCEKTGPQEVTVLQLFRFPGRPSADAPIGWKPGLNKAEDLLIMMRSESVKLMEPIPPNDERCKEVVLMRFRQPHSPNSIEGKLDAAAREWAARWDLDQKHRADLIENPVWVRFPCDQIAQ